MNEKSVKENLATMNFKEKCSYLLYYYKVHIIVFFIFLFSIGIFAYSAETQKNIYLNIAYIGNSVSPDTSEEIQTALTKSLLPNSDSDVIEFNAFDLSNSAALTKFQVSLAAHDIDIAIVNKDFFNQNYASELFLDLSSINGFSSLNIDDNSLIKKEQGIYGIKINILSNLNVLNSQSGDDNILVVISNSENSTKLIDLLKSCGIN